MAFTTLGVPVVVPVFSALAAMKALTAAGSGASVELTAAMLAVSRVVRSAASEAVWPPEGATSATDICMNSR